MIQPLHTVLFDLDGTLLDSAAGVGASMVHTFKAMGSEFDMSQIKRFVGPPLFQMFLSAFGSEEEARRAQAIYRAHHREVGMALIKSFPGVRELLEALRAEQKRLIVATSRMQQTAGELLQREGLWDYFDAVIGARPDGVNAEKIDVMRHVVKTLALDVGGCVMVGDRRYDVEGASAVGMRSIVVGYGCGVPGEFDDAPPTYFAENMQALKALLLSGGGADERA